MPVIRDLVVDMSQFFNQYRAVKPYLIRHDANRKSNTAKARAARPARRLVRMHPVRLLFRRLPVVLVEPGKIPWPGRVAASLALARRLA